MAKNQNAPGTTDAIETIEAIDDVLSEALPHDDTTDSVDSDVPVVFDIPADSYLAAFAADGSLLGWFAATEDSISAGFTVAGSPGHKIIRAIGDTFTNDAKAERALASMQADLDREAKLEARLAKVRETNAAKAAKVAKLRGDLAEAVGDLQAANVEVAKVLAGEEVPTIDGTSDPVETPESDGS